MTYRGPMDFGKDRQAPIGGDAVGPAYNYATVTITTEIVPMPTRFTVIDSFHSEEFHSDYVAGLSYEAVEGRDDKLLELLPKWIEEGKVREGGPEAIVSGTAEATEETEK